MESDKPDQQHNVYYKLVLRHLQDLWKEDVVLVPDTAASTTGEHFSQGDVRVYPTVTFNGLTYGSEYKTGGKLYRHAYIDGRIAVRTAVILHVKHTRRNLPPLEHTCAIVRHFVVDPHTPAMPWDLQ